MIQRFIILHLNIHEWSFPNSQRNEQSAEDTSSDELQIPILYYYETNNDDDDNNDGIGLPVLHSTAAITGTVHRRIQFAGLCQALYHLPDTWLLPLPRQSGHRSNHRTKMVQYDSNTALVFVPLHDENICGRPRPNVITKRVDIVAVAQIVTGMLSPSTHHSNHHNITTSLPSSPTAIYQAIQRSYLQFCLLRNGTIHERLLQHHTNNNKNDDEYYPGMDQLYFYYRQQRRRTSTKSSNDTLEQFPTIESYTKLRHDLQYHFDDVWTVTPNYHHTGSWIDAYHIPTVPNFTASPFVHWNEQEWKLQQQQQNVLPEAIHRHIMSTMARQPSSSSTPYVLGMSVFMANQQLMAFNPLHKVDQCPVIDTTSLQHAIQTTPNQILLLADECAIIMFQYMKQIQSRIAMQQQHHQPPPPLSDRSTATTSEPIRKSSSFAKLLRPFALSFMKDDCMVSSPIKLSSAPPTTATATTTAGTTLHNVSNDCLGIFLAPPPFSLLSVLDDDQSTSFVYQEAEMEEDNVSTVYVWAPSVALPITELMVNDTSERDTDQSACIRKTVPARMCLYMRQHVQCLLYLSRPDHSNIDDSESNSSRVHQDLFHEISRQIDKAIDEVTDSLDVRDQNDHANQIVEELVQNCSSSTTTSWDIQYSSTLPFIHKPGMNVFVMDRLKHTISVHIDDDGTRPHDVARATNQNRLDLRRTDAPSLSQENDMRNFFIKHLPLNTVLALEDAIEEVHQFIQRNSASPSYESCTLLQQQWLYSYYACHTELYILFRTSHFVTISDVQQEAQRIRNAYVPHR